MAIVENNAITVKLNCVLAVNANGEQSTDFQIGNKTQLLLLPLVRHDVKKAVFHLNVVCLFVVKVFD